MALAIDAMIMHDKSREFDLIIMIALSIERGNNISTMLTSSTPALVECLNQLKAIYDIVDKPKKNPNAVTLSRVASCYPHISCAYMAFAKNIVVSKTEMRSFCKDYPIHMMCQHFTALIPKNHLITDTLKKAHMSFLYLFTLKISSQKKKRKTSKVVADVWKYLNIAHEGSY